MPDSIFYPDNPLRIRRFEGLNTHIYLLSIDVISDKRKIEEFQHREALKQHLQNGGLKVWDNFEPEIDLPRVDFDQGSGAAGAAKLKDELIQGIHKLQRIRLLTAYLRQQAHAISELHSLFTVYLELQSQGQSNAAQLVGEKVKETFRSRLDRISLQTLEEGHKDSDFATHAYVPDDDAFGAIISWASQELDRLR